MTGGPSTSGNGTVAAAAIGGDRDAIAALWRENRRWIAAVLLAHKSPDDHLEDLLQEVAMTLVRQVGSVRDPGNVRAWLRTVAINAARASARSSRVRPWHRRGDPVPQDRAAPSRDEAALDDEARALLAAAATLPELYREPLLLRAVHGMTGRQIGAIMDLPDATVETRIARARRMLRAAMERSSQAAAPATTREGRQ